MKIKLLAASLMLAGAMNVMAQGYQDGIDYFNAYRLDDAKELLQKNLDNEDTDKALAHYYLGLIDIEQKNLTGAEQNFQAGIAANSKNPYCYIGMGQLTLPNNPKEAENYFKQAEKLGKKDAAVSAAIGRAYFNVDPKAYNKQVCKYIEKGHKDSKYMSPAIYMLEGDTAAYHRNSGAAAGKYEMAIQQAKDAGGRINPEAYVKNANLHLKINPTYAIQQLKQLNEDEPTSALAQRELAEKYYDLDMLPDAVKQYGMYINNPNHFTRDEQRYAGLLYLANAFSQSLEWADKVLAKEPDNFYMNRMRMYCLYDLGRYEEAAKEADNFFNLKNVQFNFKDYEYLGDIYSEMERSGESADAYLKAYELDNSKNMLLSKCAYEFYMAEKYGNATRYQQLFVDKGNNDDASLFRLATFSKSYGDELAADSTQTATAAQEAYRTSLDAIDAAIAKNPAKGSYYRFKGLTIYASNGNKESLEMVDAFNKMTEAYKAEKPDSYMTDYAAYMSSPFLLCGKYYLDQKDYANAKKWLNDYLQVTPESEQTQQVAKIVKQI